ncbi:copper amine oxidase N-terminal domain-containing protein [Maledivibacter halophilus]|uniref:Copper amine oxidase N-terminal domain-containing protein n=1 Tax=Maledivibacter halophilus TaxID=36842 RepID=A0A1T5L3A7_9FIRM|nr:copper amine oxidase N-terminal domain-containing protein [Maledivibacter halophilus]SKC70497.1 Copper amine oxidase N-terminal domain-containing protein [Maledivibacter halophilus]
MKKIIILSLVLVLVLSLNVFAEGNYKFDEEGKLIKVDENFDNTVDVEVDGVKIKFKDAKPFINKQNRTVVPVRFIAEALGAKVDWNGETRTVIIDQDQKHIELAIGAMEAIVNSETVKFDTKAQIYFDRTFVPLRFVSEALGATVGWNGETRTVTIDTKSKEEQVEVPKNVEEMIAELDDEELKEIVKTSSNNYVENKVVFYGIDGEEDLDSIGAIVSHSNYHKNSLITVFPRFYDKDYSVLKDMLKVYYPTKFETVYAYVSNVIDNEKPTGEKAEEFIYDGRSFACAKGESAVSIYIGGKANE